MSHRREINPNFFTKDSSGTVITSASGKSHGPSSRSTGAASGGSNNLAMQIKRARSTGTMNMSNCNLTAFPMDICNYNTLPLDNALNSSDNFWEMYPLTKLDLSYNSISSIPREIFQLPDLVSLKLRDNMITAIPEELAACKELSILDLTNNKISHIGPFIGNLYALKEVQLSGNMITDVHPSISNCTAIHTLQLSNNRLKSFPDVSRDAFPYLTNLNLSNNLLENLPDISNIESLTILDLKRNKLMYSPDLSRFRALISLDLSENNLNTFPERLPVNGSLDRLHLSHNKITVIDTVSLLRLRDTLTELHINDNKIKDLPMEIGYLNRLALLNISNNDMNDLPYSLGYISTLSKILLDGNPIRTIRRTLLIMQATNDLKGYLRTRGDPMEGQTDSDVIAKESKAVKRAPVASSSSTKVDGPLKTNAPVANPLTQYLERKVRDMIGGSLDLSKQKMISSNRNWPEVLIQVFTKFAPVSTFDIKPRSRTTSKVASIADIAGDDEINGTFSPFLLTKLDISYNDLQSLDLTFDNSGRTLLSCTQSSPCILESIEWLNISHNLLFKANISSVSEYLYLLPMTLKYLDISYNKLTDRQIDNIIQGLVALQEVNLSGNLLEVFPRSLYIAASKIRVIRISNTRLRSIDDVNLKQFPYLEILDLSDNQLTNIEIIVDVFKGSTYTGTIDAPLSSLFLANNSLKEIPSELCLFRNLRYLTLHGNPQKIIRTSQLDNIESVFATLRNKLPSSHITENISKATDTSRSRITSSASVKAYSSGTMEESSVRTLPPKTQGLTSSNSMSSLAQLESDILDIEQQLVDDYSLSSAKRQQLQKSLALKRANYNRMK